MKIEEDKMLLRKQREPGRPGCLGSVDKKLADKEETVRQRRLEEEEWIVGKTRTGTIKTDFQNNLPDIVKVHWDGKPLPGLDVRSSKEERFPIIVAFDDRERLLAVPKLESSSGKHQTKALSTALFD
ncbi:hypothetical protein EVAR_22674_1 [Eumeta japonica]|uniref:Uncharacterized protein n=1 Tax=Eumeta variegata TaxID=151549 RepID=A0A4C1VLS4_EUMVA|nr:hypothetical protein EVAR_22674_1 [Eumeta japonica]